jgi:predicted DNA-binding protein (MmcQ/YjbR family)
VRETQLTAALLDLPETSWSEPFAPGVPVFKVAGKVFAILQPEDHQRAGRITLKCDPDLALHLRQQFAAVIAGYHVNKRLWNTVVLDGSVPDEDLSGMLLHSYEEVVGGMPRDDRVRLLAALHASGKAGPA